jgi:hypothetical protein
MGKAEIEKDPSIQILEKVSKWLPPSIIDQLKKKSLTPVDIIRLLSLLPPESRDNFPSVPETTLVFPRDHNMHLMQNQEWYYLALNLKGKNNGKRYGALSSIVRHTLDSPMPALFAPMKYNQVFRSSFSLTSTSGDSDESSKKDIHYYVGDQGGYLGDYRPAVVGKLPACSWDEGKQGLIPPVNEDGESIKGKMVWSIKGEVKGRPCGFKIELTPKAPILLNGPSGKGTISHPAFGASYMYYSFPYLEANGIVVLPDGTEEEVHGSGWLDHQGGVQKSADVNITYLMQWKHFLKHKIHRPAWIWTMVQFPQSPYKLFLNGSVILKNPLSLEEGQVLPWTGNMQLDGHSTEVKGKCKVVEIFESPTLENVRYTTQLILTLAGVIPPASGVGDAEDLVVEIKSIYRDQRVFPADQGEIYEGAAEAVLLSTRGTAKPQGTGFIENMAFSSMEQLEKQQYDSLGIAPTVGNMHDMFKREVGASTAMSTTGPVVTIVLFLLCVAIALGIYFKKNKK